MEDKLLIHSYIGGWELLNGSATSTWSINDPLFLSQKAMGNPAFFTMDIAIDDKNSSQYILEVCIISQFLCYILWHYFYF